MATPGQSSTLSTPSTLAKGAAHARHLGGQAGLGALVGVACGLASAAFLALLEVATDTREDHLWLVFLLPVAGLVVGWLYARFGAPIAGGTDVIIDHVEPIAGQTGPITRVPLRMAPMVLIGTVLTHLFGGSAGREGTAVQMGGSLADCLGRLFRLPPETRRTLVVAGVAGGFGSVFGTPIAGLIFALEFTTVGRLHHTAILPALAAAIIGDMTTHATGVAHTPYPTLAAVPLDGWLLLKWLVVAAAMALAAATFIEVTHTLRDLGRRYLKHLALRMFVGGIAVVALWQLVGSSTYLGLGVPTILESFSGDAPTWAFALKLLFTAITIGAGFLGGEVTPLFFIGASLGATLAPILDIPTALGAAVGLAAVFGAASNAPIALSIMTVEILGGAALPHVGIVCVLAWLMTGHRGIYGAQRFARLKSGAALAEPVPLRELRSLSRTRLKGQDASDDAGSRPR